jgi:L-fuconate dehydratase
MTVVRTGAPLVEYVDHLHEHSIGPVVVRGGRYLRSTRPGYGVRLRPESVARFSVSDGPVWAGVS